MHLSSFRDYRNIPSRDELHRLARLGQLDPRDQKQYDWILGVEAMTPAQRDMELQRLKYRLDHVIPQMEPGYVRLVHWHRVKGYQKDHP